MLSLVLDTVEIAFSTKTTVYDAIFVATAELHQANLVTADKKFVDTVKKLDSVCFLADIGKLGLE